LTAASGLSHQSPACYVDEKFYYGGSLKKISLKFSGSLIFLLVSTAFVVLSAGMCHADSEAPARSCKVVTDDGKYVFVMHPIKGGFSSYPDKGMLAKYPKSGLYRNDGSAEPLWTIDWYSRGGVHLFPDGKYLIRIGNWPLGSPCNEKNYSYEETLIRLHNKQPIGPIRNDKALSQLAVAFYESGMLLKEYSIGDLTKEPSKLPTSISHFQWIKNKVYDDAKGQISIITYDGQMIVFDNMGKIVSRSVALDK